MTRSSLAESPLSVLDQRVERRQGEATERISPTSIGPSEAHSTAASIETSEASLARPPPPSQRAMAPARLCILRARRLLFLLHIGPRGRRVGWDVELQSTQRCAREIPMSRR